MIGTASPTHETRHWKMLAAGAIAVLALMLGFAWLRVPEPGLIENRVAREWPGWPANFEEAVSLPAHIDAYIQDHFPPRQHFIGWLNYLRYKMGYTGLPRVVVGKDGWLFMNQGHFFYHNGIARLSSDQLEQWVASFRKRVDDAHAHGASLFLFFPPEKPSLYPEMLPGWMRPTHKTELLDMIAAAGPELQKRVVYPLAELQTAKAERPIFGPYDTHWNGYGGYAGYHALMTAIRALHPEIEGPLPRDAFTLNTQRSERELPRDLAGMIGIGNLVQVEHPTYSSVPQHDLERTQFLTADRDWWNAQVIFTDSDTERTLLLVRDSFSVELLPFLKPHFRTIVLAHGWDGYTRNDLIERFRPDIVIMETIETGARQLFGTGN